MPPWPYQGGVVIVSITLVKTLKQSKIKYLDPGGSHGGGSHLKDWDSDTALAVAATLRCSPSVGVQELGHT